MQRRILLALCCAACLAAQNQVSKPISDKERKKREQKLRRELAPVYGNWLKTDVAYIITDPERKAFDGLSNDDERERFVEQFWLRRDPTPDTEENEFKEEHYRRIAYSNERFASGIPGWKTDRGRIYIVHGPPDEIESHASGGVYQRPIEQGGGQTSVYPFEQWRYRHLDQVGDDVVIEFVDSTLSGEYRMTTDPSEKDALKYVPGSQQQPAANVPLPRMGLNEFEVQERAANLFRPPAVKFKDLEALVTSSVRYNAFPMRVRIHFIPLTPTSILSNITLQFDRNDLQFQHQDGVAKAVVNLYARISTLTRRTVNVFEDVVTVEGAPAGIALYQKTVPLAPGRYRLNIAAKDVIGGNTSSYETALDVPQFEDDQLTASSLILADVMERVPARNIGTGQFIIGDMKVRPRMSETFRTDEKLGIYIQLYHFALNAVSRKPDGVIEYQILKSGLGEPVVEYSEELASLAGSTSQITVEKWLPLSRLASGSYVVRIKVLDRSGGQTIAPEARFVVVGPKG